MKFRCRETPDEIIVYLTDAKIVADDHVQEVGVGLNEFCKRAARSNKGLEVNFGDVQFISSSVIGKLVLLHKMAKTNSVGLRFSEICPSVMKVFEITKLDRVFAAKGKKHDARRERVPQSREPRWIPSGYAHVALLLIGCLAIPVIAGSRIHPVVGVMVGLAAVSIWILLGGRRRSRF